MIFKTITNFYFTLVVQTNYLKLKYIMLQRFGTCVCVAANYRFAGLKYSLLNDTVRWRLVRAPLFFTKLSNVLCA